MLSSVQLCVYFIRLLMYIYFWHEIYYVGAYRSCSLQEYGATVLFGYFIHSEIDSRYNRLTREKKTQETISVWCKIETGETSLAKSMRCVYHLIPIIFVYPKIILVGDDSQHI